MKQRSVMSHQFSQVPRAEIPRSSFDRSHGHKTTLDAGKLVPIYLDEVLPGDTFNMKMTGFARMATPIFPVMDNLYMDVQFWFVPIRLVWENFQKFMGEQDNPGDSTDFLVPVQSSFTVNPGSLYDYLGIPVGVADIEGVNALPRRCYNLIWNEWYRDQNLQDSVTVSTGDGPDAGATTGGGVLNRGKRHDYFTSCLPWPQKGEAVDLPLGDRAPVGGIDGRDTLGIDVANLDSAADHYSMQTDGVNATFNAQVGGPQDDNLLYADLTSATSVTINVLRQAFQIQKLLERDARGGTRYTELIRAHFGVVSPDMRLQRPEYLGGGSSPIQISPVPQTSATDPAGPDASPQGNLAAYATGAISGTGFVKSFTEHGYVFGMISIRADLTYQHGLNRLWSRQTKYDFFWPALSHIGEQAVLNKEIFLKDSVEADNVFGYQERFGEYRYHPSRISGLFRSDAPESLDAWHLSQDFDDLPVLGDAFIQDNPPVARVIAVQDEPEFILDTYFSLRCARPMPLYGTPGFTDRF